jgi:protein translocase SecG subunit
LAVLEIILTILIALLGIALIIVIVMQESGQQGLGSIDGSAQTFMKQQGTRTRAEKLRRYTIIGGISMVVLSTAMVVIQRLFS